MDTKLIDNSAIEDVVRIHETAFNGFFLTDLGPSFLATYYKSVNKAQDGILIGCYDERRLVGFVSGSLLCNGFNRRLIKQNAFAFIKAGLYLLFTRPQALMRLKHNLEKGDKIHADDGNYVELASIGVDPNQQGKGVGRMLLKAFEDYCYEKNQRLITLTTDFEGNDTVVDFYKRNGYEVWYDFVTYPKRRMYKMKKML